MRSAKTIERPKRHQRLAQVLALHPSKDEELHGDADDCAADKRNDKAEQPRVGPLRRLVAHIAAEQIERAVGEVDVAHQPEDQGEAGGDQKVQSAERDSVEQRVDEQPLFAEHVLKARRPGREHEPQKENHGNGDDQRPDGVTPDPARQARRHAPQTVAAPRRRSWSPRLLRFLPETYPNRRMPRHARQSDFLHLGCNAFEAPPWPTRRKFLNFSAAP